MHQDFVGENPFGVRLEFVVDRRLQEPHSLCQVEMAHAVQKVVERCEAAEENGGLMGKN